MAYGEWCPTCGAEIVSITRGIPSMGTCANGHKTDRRDVLRREPESELSKAQAEIAKLRADLANAGAVMVEALIERLHLCDDEARKIADRISGPIGQPNRCPDGVQVLEDAETIIRAAIRALSTLSPIAAAAGVLLANTEAANDPEIGPWLRAIAE